jgi:DNA processing protein
MEAAARRKPTRGPGYRAPHDVALVDCEQLLGPLTAVERRHAPPCVWIAGEAGLARAPLRVSVVGSRRVSEPGARRAAKLARALARAGVVVVSGLAEGVDGIAHRATIDAGGRTIAVIGTTIDRCYPAGHASLQTEIYTHHLLVSQFDPAQPTFPSGFARRNRLMALVSHASVVVEAGDSSGTLSQAAETIRLGRPLFIMRSVAERSDLDWPKRFIAGGALVLDDVDGVLSVLAQRALDQPVAGALVEPIPLVLPGCEVACEPLAAAGRASE